MANKKADFKLDEVTPDVINTCWVCGRRFLATHIMANPICPNCEKTRVKKLINRCKVCGRGLPKDKIMCDDCLEAVRMKSPIRVPKKGAVPPASVNDVTMDFVSATALADQMSKSPWGDLPPTQQKIHEIMGAMKDLLLYKNQKYGDSAINPKGIFYKGDSTNSILIRLDDKLGRVMSNTEDKPRVNDVCDIIGYCTLLLISMGVTAEDIAKFKD